MTLTQKLRTNRAALIEARKNHTTPGESVAELIEKIGYENAVEIVAAMVNAKGEWDGRISRANREWATSQNAPDRNALDDMCVWYCDEIHPANMNEIASAMREAERPAEAAEEPEETEQERTDRENRERCKRIAEELEAHAEGEVYRCTECGEICTIEEDEDEEGFTIYRTSCGHVLDYEPDQMSVYDFIADALDIEVTCSLDREYRSARIMVSCGGPNIYIDTARKEVQLYWWTDRAEYPISYEASDALDDAIAEYWEVR